jgi:hypothetical protein
LCTLDSLSSCWYLPRRQFGPEPPSICPTRRFFYFLGALSGLAHRPFLRALGESMQVMFTSTEAGSGGMSLIGVFDQRVILRLYAGQVRGSVLDWREDNYQSANLAAETVPRVRRVHYKPRIPDSDEPLVGLRAEHAIKTAQSYLAGRHQGGTSWAIHRLRGPLKRAPSRVSNPWLINSDRAPSARCDRFRKIASASIL